MGSGVEWSVLVELIPFGVFLVANLFRCRGCGHGEIRSVYMDGHGSGVALHGAGVAYHPRSMELWRRKKYRNRIQTPNLSLISYPLSVELNSSSCAVDVVAALRISTQKTSG